MDQSVFQRNSQLHQPKRRRSDHSQVSPATFASAPPLPDVTGVSLLSFVCSQLGTAYVSATTGAVATALGLNALTKVSTHPSSSRLARKCSDLGRPAV